MIQKLRRRFVLTAMLALVLVLAAIMGAINYLNYRNVVREADLVLDMLLENGGQFPDMAARIRPDAFLEAPDGAQRDDPPDGMRMRNSGSRLDSPELAFESRWFTVRLDADGTAETAELGNIAAVDEATALSCAERAGSRQRGFVGDYRFARGESDGSAMLVFLDCGRSLMVFRSFRLTSMLISLFGLAAVFGLTVLFSGRVIRPAVESDRKQRQFITDAGHELKTPLAILSADSEVLAMEVGEDNEWIQDIQRQTRRMSELTGDLVALARMEEADQARFVECSLSDAVEETAGDFRAAAQAQGKKYTVSVEPMLTIRGDEKALRRLTSILLDNAMKYSDEGGEIALTLRRQGRQAVLRCENTTDQPVPKEDLPRLFERFYRAEKSRNSEKGGSGIGLSIAHAVATGHRGKIHAEGGDGRLAIVAALPLSGRTGKEQSHGGAR